MQFSQYLAALKELHKAVLSDTILKENTDAAELLTDLIMKYKPSYERMNATDMAVQLGENLYKDFISEFAMIYNLYNKNNVLETFSPNLIKELPPELVTEINIQKSEISRKEARRAQKRQQRGVVLPAEDAAKPKVEILKRFDSEDQPDEEEVSQSPVVPPPAASAAMPEPLVSVVPKTAALNGKPEPDVAAVAPATPVDDDEDEEIDEVIVVVPEGKIDADLFRRAVQRFVASDGKIEKTPEINQQMRTILNSTQDLSGLLDISSKEVSEFIKLYNSFPLAEPADYDDALPHALKEAITKAKTAASAAVASAEPKPIVASAGVAVAAAAPIDDEPSAFAFIGIGTPVPAAEPEPLVATASGKGTENVALAGAAASAEPKPIAASAGAAVAAAAPIDDEPSAFAFIGIGTPVPAAELEPLVATASGKGTENVALAVAAASAEPKPIAASDMGEGLETNVASSSTVVIGAAALGEQEPNTIPIGPPKSSVGKAAAAVQLDKEDIAELNKYAEEFNQIIVSNDITLLNVTLKALMDKSKRSADEIMAEVIMLIKDQTKVFDPQYVDLYGKRKKDIEQNTSTIIQARIQELKAEVAKLEIARKALENNPKDMNILKTLKETLEYQINSIKDVKRLEAMKIALQDKVKDWRQYEAEAKGQIDDQDPANKINPAYRQAFAEKMVDNAKALIPIIDARIKQVQDEAKRNAAPPPVGGGINASLVANLGKATAAAAAAATSGSSASLTARKSPVAQTVKLPVKGSDGRYKQEDLKRLQEDLEKIKKDPNAGANGFIADEMIVNIDRYHALKPKRVGEQNQVHDNIEINIPMYAAWANANLKLAEARVKLQKYKNELEKIRVDEKQGYKFFNEKEKDKYTKNIDSKIELIEAFEKRVNKISVKIEKIGQKIIDPGHVWDKNNYQSDMNNAIKAQNSLKIDLKDQLFELDSAIADGDKHLVTPQKPKTEFLIGSQLREQFKRTKPLEADTKPLGSFSEYLDSSIFARKMIKHDLSERAWSASLTPFGEKAVEIRGRREADRRLYEGVMYLREKTEPGRVEIKVPDSGTIQQHYDKTDGKAKIKVNPPGDKAILIMLDNCQTLKNLIIKIPHVEKELAKPEEIDKEDMMNVFKALAASKLRGGVPVVEIDEKYRKILTDKFGEEFSKRWEAINNISPDALDEIIKNKEYTLSGLVDAITDQADLTAEASANLQLGKAPKKPP